MPNFKKTLVIVFVFVFSFSLAGCSILGYNLNFLSKDKGEKTTSKQVTLTYWSLFEDYEVISPLIEEYQKEHPNIKIVFEQKDFDNLNSYKDSLLAKLIQGDKTPDIMRIHQTWVPDFVPYLYPSPEIFSALDLQKEFYPSAYNSVVFSDKVYAVPLMFDSLALFYNKDIFDFAKVSPPSTWSDFADLAVNLTKSNRGKIEVSGAAIGNSTNVAHFSDIISLMIMQSGLTLPEDFTSPAMADIIKFYTSFVKDTPVWSSDFAYSPLSFAQGKVAMMFGTSWRLVEILRENPSLNIGVVPVPQAVSDNSLTDNNVTSFWVESVNKSSSNSEEAWKFLKWLSEEEQLIKLFTSASAIRPFGEPYPRVSMQKELASNPYLPPFFANAEKAQSSVFTDASGNDPYVKILQNVVEGYLGGEDLDKLLSTAQKEYSRLNNKKDR